MFNCKPIKHLKSGHDKKDHGRSVGIIISKTSHSLKIFLKARKFLEGKIK